MATTEDFMVSVSCHACETTATFDSYDDLHDLTQDVRDWLLSHQCATP